MVGEDASHLSLQPTCCHENPNNPASPDRVAFTLTTAASGVTLSSAPTCECRSPVFHGGAG